MLVATLMLGAALAAPCEPFDGPQTTRVMRTPQAVTEYFPGAYRVTHCDAAGRPQRAMTVARIATPTAAPALVPVAEETPASTVFLLYGDPEEPTWAQAWLEHGSRATRRVLAPAGPMPPDLDRAASDDSCRNGAYSTFARWPSRRYAYQANERRMSRAFRVAVTAGHHAWDDTRDSCGYGDQRNISSIYAGHVSGSIHTYADGRSVVDKGRLAGLCGGGVTLACTWTFTTAAGIVETDQRYGTGWPWSTKRRAGFYDVESVAAHETGHSIGLDHSNSSPYLTMYHQICAGCTRPRTLARGDVRGLRALY